MKRRLLYSLAGTGLALVAFLPLSLWIGHKSWVLLLPAIVGGNAAVWWAERTGRIQTPEELAKPTTLNLS